VPAPPPDWQAQFRTLGSALGLDPDKMLSDFCRGWVEHTRGKALAADLKQLPAGSEAA
jgi:hypothetical protein